ncbi:MAG: hypothetical protein E4H14_05690, partial [Candidatus Thorarchaeota archaeon]
MGILSSTTRLEENVSLSKAGIVTNHRTRKGNQKWKLRLLSLFYILLICSQVTLTSNAYSQNETKMHSLLEADTFFSYTITTALIREWNYTIDGSSLITYNGSVFYAPQVSSTIQIRIEFITDTTISVRYQASTDVGYNVDYAIEAEYDSDTGQIVITNGSLAGFSGFTGLFSNDEWKGGITTISEIGAWNVTAEFIQENIAIEINSVYQKYSYYNCTSYDAVDGERIHQRLYDSDTGILLQANGAISDPFIFGLGNISYFLGEVRLTDTNFDLGPPENIALIFVVMILGIVAIVVVAILSIVFIKARRRQSQGVSK